MLNSILSPFFWQLYCLSFDLRLVITPLKCLQTFTKPFQITDFCDDRHDYAHNHFGHNIEAPNQHITSRKSKDRQYSCQKKGDKMTNIDLQSTTSKTNDWETRIHIFKTIKHSIIVWINISIAIKSNPLCGYFLIFPVLNHFESTHALVTTIFSYVWICCFLINRRSFH
jgi:hypothetical protein